MSISPNPSSSSPTFDMSGMTRLAGHVRSMERLGRTLAETVSGRLPARKRESEKDGHQCIGVTHRLDEGELRKQEECKKT